MWNKILLNVAKLAFGVFFIVSGATKVKALSEGAKVNGAILNAILPFLLLAVGLLIFVPRLTKISGIAGAILILVQIVIILLGIPSGNCLSCNIIFNLSLTNIKNPLSAISLNFAFLLVSSVIIFQGLLLSTKHNVFKILVFPGALLIFLMLILISSHLRQISIRTFIAAAAEEREHFYQISHEPVFAGIIGSKLTFAPDIVSLMDPGQRFIVLLTIRSFDCLDCIKEAVFLEQLKISLGEQIFFCATTLRIGRTALDNFRNEYGLTYPILEIPEIFNISLFGRFNSIKVLLSRQGKVLRIDPITFGIENFKEEYKNLLLGYLKMENN